MRLLWFGSFLMSVSWLFTLPLLGRPGWQGPCLAGIGLLAFAIAFRRHEAKSDSSLHGLLFLLLLPSLLLLPDAHRLGLAAVIVAGAGLAVIPKRIQLDGLLLGLGTGGLILCLHSVILVPYLTFACRFHDLPFVAQATGGILTSLGMEASMNSTSLFVEGSQQVLEFSVTHEKFGLYVLLNLMVASTPLVFLESPRLRWRRLFHVILICSFFAIIRFLAIVLAVVELDDSTLLWNRWVMILSFLPLGFLLCALSPRQIRQVRSPFSLNVGQWHRQHVVIAVLIAGAVALLIGAWGFCDPGRKLEGRVLIDESHSNWEWTDLEYDTEWYGQKSGYNYNCLFRYLQHFYDAQINTERISARTLKGCDLLIIKVPTESYSSEEIEAVENYVRKGGGLLLIGDHTNVFGSSTYLNAIAKRFDLSFDYNSSYAIKTGGLFVYDRPSLLPHPVVADLDRFLFGTSCTLSIPLSARAMMVGHGLRCVLLDYAGENFFNHAALDPDVDVGSFVLTAGRPYGKGRVIAFTDSTVFSNFWMFLPGKKELFMGMTEWALRQNLWPYLNHVSLVCAFILGIAVVSLWRTTPRHLAAAWLAVSIAFPIGMLSFSWMNDLAYPPPEPERPFTRVAFDARHGDFALPSLGLVQDINRDFHTFFVWTQRLGYVPEVTDQYMKALQRADIMVIPNPRNTFSESEITQTLAFIERGGLLVVLDRAEKNISTANQILAEFDITVEPHRAGSHVIVNLAGETVAINRPGGVVFGGQPLLLTELDEPVLVVRNFGKGQVIAGSDSELFTACTMGGVNTVPNERQRRLYEVEFDMLRRIFLMREHRLDEAQSSK